MLFIRMLSAKITLCIHALNGQHVLKRTSMKKIFFSMMRFMPCWVLHRANNVGRYGQNMVCSEEQDIAVFKHVMLKINLKLCQSEITKLNS